MQPMGNGIEAVVYIFDFRPKKQPMANN